MSAMAEIRTLRAPKRCGVKAWMPHYRTLGYSRQEAEQLVRIAETLWNRYTARGLTIDSPRPTPTALDPFEVLIQAICQLGVRDLFGEDSPIRRRSVH